MNASYYLLKSFVLHHLYGCNAINGGACNCGQETAEIELAALQTRLDAAQALVTKWRSDDPYEWTASDKRQCADALEAALQPQPEQEA